MSRRLASVLFALAILLSAMELKTALTAIHSNGTVLQANGPAPVPPPPPKKPA